MKKVLVALALVMASGSSVVFAQEVKDSVTVEKTATPQDEFVKMPPTELPQTVLYGLAKDYEGSSIKEAFVKEKNGTKIYKIIVVAKSGEESEVIVNGNGEAVKE